MPQIPGAAWCWERSAQRYVPVPGTRNPSMDQNPTASACMASPATAALCLLAIGYWYNYCYGVPACGCGLHPSSSRASHTHTMTTQHHTLPSKSLRCSRARLRHGPGNPRPDRYTRGAQAQGRAKLQGVLKLWCFVHGGEGGGPSAWAKFQHVNRRATDISASRSLDP